MSSRNYPRLGIEEFGAHLLASGDLDPVYLALSRLRRTEGALDPTQLSRWLVAYWCLYHCGAASYLCEYGGSDFTDGLMHAARQSHPAPVEGGRWPRGHERRYFRGEQAEKAVLDLQLRYDAHLHRMVDAVGTQSSDPVPVTCATIMRRVQTHYLFGPWIAFKVADMLERVLGQPVSFDRASVLMFKEPREAALMVWRDHHKLPEGARPRDEAGAVDSVVGWLTQHFARGPNPLGMDRSVGLQEVETILCKWKSHRNGHYPLMNDVVEIREGLAEWAPHSRVADLMLHAMPEVPT